MWFVIVDIEAEGQNIFTVTSPSLSKGHTSSSLYLSLSPSLSHLASLTLPNLGSSSYCI